MSDLIETACHHAMNTDNDFVAYRRWWVNEGSAMRPLGNEDAEEHAHRVTEIAWLNGAYCARAAIEPVPTSERLPGPEDCDAEGRCWFFHTSTIGGNEWFLNQLPKVSEWYRWQSITHWLPFHALPLPEGGAA